MKKEYEGSESEILSAVSEQLGESSKTKKGINCHSLFSFLKDVYMMVHAFSVCVHIMSLSCQSLCFLPLLAIFVGCAFHVCCFSCFIVRIFGQRINLLSKGSKLKAAMKGIAVDQLRLK